MLGVGLNLGLPARIRDSRLAGGGVGLSGFLEVEALSPGQTFLLLRLIHTEPPVLEPGAPAEGVGAIGYRGRTELDSPGAPVCGGAPARTVIVSSSEDKATMKVLGMLALLLRWKLGLRSGLLDLIAKPHLVQKDFIGMKGRLDKNYFTGSVPVNINNLTEVTELDMSNNSFDPSETPVWFSELSSLTALVIESGGIHGKVPEKLFSFPQLEQVLIGNPVCSTQLSNTVYCRPPQLQGSPPYSTSITHCGKIFCKTGQSLSPQSCACAYPYQGLMVFRAPRFRDLTNVTLFQSLESSFWMKLGLTPGSVLIENPMFDSDSYLELQVNIFPPERMYFSRSEIIKIGFDLSNQTYKPPPMFGPYYFIATPYPFPASSWENSNKGSDGAPQLKGARWFSFEELKKSSNDFSEVNEVGSGGYGKVYRGVLVGGQLVAIKRAQRGSMQGGLEFKTEIELLSRVHHKNLVGLVGFCFEHGEQILVYEFISNGTLRDNLIGLIDVKSSNILLDDNLTAKVADFGLSLLVSDPEKGHVSTQVKGTLGYLDPEYYMSQQLTEKSDVYSFGVVMLELITARQPIERGKYVVREFKMAMNRNDEEFYGLKEFLDPHLLSTVSTVGFGRFVELAMRCVEESAAHRPTMSEVVKEIETILHNDGFNTNSTSASSSATDFGNAKAAFRHIYSDSFAGKELKEGAFDYSGGLTLSAKPEPK
ncbi:putative leucine-rich repeat receptor-like protein kinase [Platanthera guangdongensis]|uniref:Leucine-rich repeat receptor-like protein kinase n=1 Tax=Platanthera guangdongensis TaxID=2320717 RepID=A0ABR2MG95_9ASPA